MLSHYLIFLLVVLFSSACWVLLDVTRKQLAEHFTPPSLLFALMVAQTLLMAALMMGNGWSLPLGQQYWVASGISILFNALANILFIFSVQRAPLSLVIPTLAVGVVFAPIGGIFLLDESHSLQQYFGVMLVLFSVGALNWFNQAVSPELNQKRMQGVVFDDCCGYFVVRCSHF